MQDFVSAMEQSRKSEKHTVHSKRSIGLTRETSKTRESLFRVMRRNEYGVAATTHQQSRNKSGIATTTHQQSRSEGLGRGLCFSSRRAIANNVISTSASSTASPSTPFPSYSHHFGTNNNKRSSVDPAIRGWKQQDQKNIMLPNITNAEEEMKRWHRQQLGSIWNKLEEQKQEREEQVMTKKGGSSAMMRIPAPKHQMKQYQLQQPFQQYPMEQHRTKLNDVRQGDDRVQAELQRIAKDCTVIDDGDGLDLLNSCRYSNMKAFEIPSQSRIVHRCFKKFA